MNGGLAYAAFGWLTFGGTMHFVIDVLSQHLRGKRLPSPETTLYYGVHTGYALGQILFGVLGLLVARHARELLSSGPALALCGVAAAAWLAFGFVFIEYWQPKLAAGIFAALVVAMIGSRVAS